MDTADQHDLLLPLVTEENACLPLSINVVAKYWGAEIPMSEAAQTAKKYPGVRGGVLIEGIELAEGRGLRARILHSDLPHLKRLVDTGIPPIVILPGIRDTIQHASVISGYDPGRGTITHYIPKMEQDGSFHVGEIPERRFDENWSEDGRLVIVLSPPDVPSGHEEEAADSEERSNRLCFESERHNLLGNPQGSTDALNEALSLYPDNVTAHLVLGGVLNDRGSADCLGHYEECIRLNGRSYLAHRGMGNYFLKARRFDRAEQCYSEAIAINPERFGPVYKNRGIARMEQKDNAGAAADLERYLKYTPGAPDGEAIRKAIGELS